MRQLVATVLMIGCLSAHAAASQARAGAATGKSLSACGLLSRDLVEKFDTGNKQILKTFTPSEEPIGTHGSHCDDGQITFQIDPFVRSEELRANTYAELLVWTGAHHFTIQLGAAVGGSVESAKPNAIGLAHAIIAKLR
jgi:hypothetical protein